MDCPSDPARDGEVNFVPAIPGQRFGRLTVIGEAESLFLGSRRIRRFKCLCDCGNETTVLRDLVLRKGRGTKSCGCLAIEIARVVKRKHGHRSKAYTSPTYDSWQSMLDRTRAKSGDHYLHYVLRGITVCERWHIFENFLADMGPRPDGKTIDRINNDGNYEPGNCKWSTAREQRSNQRPYVYERWRRPPTMRINLLQFGATQ
jgi:hypothetical protein